MPDAEETEVVTQESDMIRPRIFNFHNVRSVIIANLNQKVNKVQKCVNKKYIQVVMDT